MPLRTTLAGLLLFVAACSAELDSIPDEAQLGCESENDCPTGRVCNLSVGVCVDRGLDVTPPAIEAGSAVLVFEGPPDCPLDSVRGLSPGGRATLMFTVSKPLVEPPLLKITSGETALETLPVAQLGTTYRYSVELPDGIPDGDYILSAVLIDAAQNEVEAVLDTELRATVDTEPPPVLTPEQLERIELQRIPWGADETGSVPHFSVSGGADAAPPGAFVLVFDGPLMSLRNLRGEGVVAEDGSFEVELDGSASKVWLALSDAACNLSGDGHGNPQLIRQVAWVATLVPDSTPDRLANPHDFTIVSSFNESLQQFDALRAEELFLVSTADSLIAAVLGGGSWRNVGNTNTSFFCTSCELSYDPVRGELLALTESSFQAWNGANWRDVSVLDPRGDGNPAQRDAMAYDPVRSRHLVVDLARSPLAPEQLLCPDGEPADDLGDCADISLWSWDGVSWEKLEVHDDEGDGHPDAAGILRVDPLADRGYLVTTKFLDFVQSADERCEDGSIADEQGACFETRRWVLENQSFRELAPGAPEDLPWAYVDMVYDVRRQQMLVLGVSLNEAPAGAERCPDGTDIGFYGGCYSSGLWVWRGDTLEHLADLPPGPQGLSLDDARMAYDPRTGGTTIVGLDWRGIAEGQQLCPDGTPPDAEELCGYLGMWEWDGESLEILPVGDPEQDGQPLHLARMVFNARSGFIELVGWSTTPALEPSSDCPLGSRPEGDAACRVDAVWRWDGHSWRQRAEADPEGDERPLNIAALGYDSNRSRILAAETVFFRTGEGEGECAGGIISPNTAFCELPVLWAWNGRSWTVEHDPLNEELDFPPFIPFLLDDAAGDRTWTLVPLGIELSGPDASCPEGTELDATGNCGVVQVWAYANGEWSELAPAAESDPPPTELWAAAWDDARGGILAFGNRREPRPAGGSCPLPLIDDENGGCLRSGLWFWDGGAWRLEHTVGLDGEPASASALVFDPTDDGFFVVEPSFFETDEDGFCPLGYLPVGDGECEGITMWSWNGSRFVELAQEPDAHTGLLPRIALNDTVFYHPERFSLVIAKSGSGAGQLWEYRGGRWVYRDERNDPEGDGSPVQDSGFAVVFDDARQALVGAGVGGTWEWADPSTLRPAHVFAPRFDPVALADGAMLQELQVQWVAGGVGFDELDELVFGSALWMWDIGVWRPLGGIANLGPNLVDALVWSTRTDGYWSGLTPEERSAALPRLLTGNDSAFVFAMTPLGNNGPEFAEVQTDYVELRVRYLLP